MLETLQQRGASSRAAKLPMGRDGGGPSLQREPTEPFGGRSAVAAKAARSGDRQQRYVAPRRFGGLRFRVRGGVPASIAGRVFAGLFVLGMLAAFTAIMWAAQSFLLRDPRLLIQSSSSIQITGNRHLTRPQLLSIFGEDVDRNLLTVSLEERRAQLESLPWVEHATVMRLLPDKIRVAITERTPVAFVRQGGHIGLVDRNGVLLEMVAGQQAEEHYSFPVITGLSAQDPLSTREARMKLFSRFTSELDAGAKAGERRSDSLSEIDLSSPEDVRALISNQGQNGADILVHFGEDDFLGRYQRYQQNLPEWLNRYPKLASVDMRYEHDVVLEMHARESVPVDAQAIDPAPAAPAGKKVPAKAKHLAQTKGTNLKIARKPVDKAVRTKPVALHVNTKAAPPAHLQSAFSVHARPSESSRAHVSPMGPR